MGYFFNRRPIIHDLSDYTEERKKVREEMNRTALGTLVSTAWKVSSAILDYFVPGTTIYLTHKTSGLRADYQKSFEEKYNMIESYFHAGYIVDIVHFSTIITAGYGVYKKDYGLVVPSLVSLVAKVKIHNDLQTAETNMEEELKKAEENSKPAS